MPWPEWNNPPTKRPASPLLRSFCEERGLAGDISAATIPALDAKEQEL
jgi:hypothetical protein